MDVFLHVRALQGFGDFEEGFMVEWGKKLVIGTNYFTDPMGNVMNLEFDDDLIRKGIFRVPYHFEDFYELDELHYICTLFCGDRYFRIRIFDTNWTEIEYPGLGNSYIAKEDLVWSKFLSSFRVKLCPTESMICLDAYFHLFWEKKVIYGEKMQFIDPCYKTFKFKFDVKANGTTVFRGGIGKMFKLFSLEGMEIDYSRNGVSCSGSGNVGSDVADPGADYSLVKCLTDYDYLNASFVGSALSRSKKEYILSNGNGNSWECSIRWAARSKSECYLGSGCKRFVSENNLCVGDSIKLEVQKDDDRTIIIKKI
ncbi:hypothetical protein DEO72_LG9g1434 [Vigna unguiculata]|uniref:TF-B3 domain-containing protein n=1 Tax=Vigna unguiculata TaxID=3917 RepID=A0A4D6N0E6_VIGUN|nr:hypothetical protein DEO72_LG9g1434 [Vigna unguiculata]